MGTPLAGDDPDILRGDEGGEKDHATQNESQAPVRAFVWIADAVGWSGGAARTPCPRIQTAPLLAGSRGGYLADLSSGSSDDDNCAGLPAITRALVW